MPIITTSVEDTSLVPLNEGPYRGRIKAVTLQAKKPGKEFPSVRVDIKLTVPPDQAERASADGTFPLTDYVSLSPKAGWRVEELLHASGLQEGTDYIKTEIDKKNFKIDWNTDLLQGRELMVTISQEPQKDVMGQPVPGGRIFNRVVSYGSLA